jgi:hypothetical protein
MGIAEIVRGAVLLKKPALGHISGGLLGQCLREEKKDEVERKIVPHVGVGLDSIVICISSSNQQLNAEWVGA